MHHLFKHRPWWAPGQQCPAWGPLDAEAFESQPPPQGLGHQPPLLRPLDQDDQAPNRAGLRKTLHSYEASPRCTFR